MSSNPPSHRSPLTLLSKLKRQLSKSPVTQHRKQPIEHQYLPIPTVSFSESLHSNRSTYSCSNNSSASSFVFIDHNEEPASDEYRPFLPLIIQHELQQRLAAVSAPPRVAPTRAQRARFIPPPPNEPPSPTSTASSKSPVTPIFSSSFLDWDEDGIMTLSSSEVGSISEYSLPTSLSAYIEEAKSIRSRRSRKSRSQTSSDTNAGAHGMPLQTPPQRTRRSFPPISPPPSCPLPEPPVYVKPRSDAPPLLMSDGESASSHLGPVRARSASTSLGLSNELTSPSPPLTPVPAIALSPAICHDTKTKVKARPESTTSILSDLEIFDPTSPFAFTIAATFPCHDLDENENDDTDDVFPTRPSPSPSTPTTPTPRQYGMGRQVIHGSGTGRDFGPDFGCTKRNSKRLSAHSKRETIPTLESKAENEIGEEPSTDVVSEVQVDQDLTTPTQTQSPTPIPRRRVKSDDPNPAVNTTHREQPRENSHPEWTLFLGIPRNAPPPPPPSSTLFSTGLPIPPTTEGPNVNHATSTLSSTAPPAMTGKNHNPQPRQTHFPSPMMTMRNRTKSDSALLASASVSSGDAKNKTKTKLEREDWTLSLPLVASPITPLSTEVPREAKPSGSELVQAEVAEECQPRLEEENLVITVEDVDDCRRGKEKRHVRADQSGEYENELKDEEEEDQHSLVLRVPRKVRSSSSRLFSSAASHTNNAASMHGRAKKRNAKWMGATSTPNLRESSCSLEEEVMLMLLGDAAAEQGDDSELISRSRSSSSLSTKKNLASAIDLAQKKIATLDEDLARFNALLRNGSSNESGSWPVGMVLETALAAATPTKTRTVTLNSHHDPIPPSTTSTSPLFKNKSKSSQALPILKPVLKHAKSCHPFLESSVNPFPPPPSMGPVMRFPSSTGGSDLTFFDELGASDQGPSNRASLRLSKSTEWMMGELALGLSAPTSPHRSTLSNSPPTTTSTQTMLLPFASSSGLKPKRSLGGFEKGVSRRGDIPTMPFRAVSMGSLSPVSGSHKGKQQLQQQQQRREKPSPPRLHTSSPSSSSSASSSSFRRHITINSNKNRQRSISPPPPLPSPIPSESSSMLPTPLASAFPLPPSSPPISMSTLDDVQQKLREFENAREKQQQQSRLQPQRYLDYKRPSTSSSMCSLVSSASSTATVVPSGDQKMKMRAVSASASGGGGEVQERVVREPARVGDVQEDDEENESTYYSARSSFSQERIWETK